MLHLSTVLAAKAQLAALKMVLTVLPIPRPLVLLGEDSAQRLCDTMAHLNAKHVLIVTDGVLFKLGIIAPIEARLQQLGIRTAVYADVTPDPTLDVVERGLAFLQRNGCDAVLAVGGGSSIDTAKVIALSASNQKKPQDLIGILKGRVAALPLFVVPTTAGTGSEVTAGAVISDAVTHQKNLVIDPKTVPLATAIDPKIMQGMPPHITADTGIDALTHALEAWMSEFASPASDDYAAAAVGMLLKFLPTAYQNGSDLAAREAVGLAAHYAGLAINQAALGYVHGLAHQLGAQYGVPHGRANAIVLPYILAFNRKASAKRLADLARRVGLAQANAADSSAAECLIAAVQALIAQVQIKTHIANMQAADFAHMIEAAFAEVHGTYAVPRYMTAAQATAILTAIAAQKAA